MDGLVEFAIEFKAQPGHYHLKLRWLSRGGTDQIVTIDGMQGASSKSIISCKTPKAGEDVVLTTSPSPYRSPTGDF